METTIQKPKSGSLFARSQKSTDEKDAAVAEVVEKSPAVAPSTTPAATSPTGEQDRLSPCPTCHSAIRWLNASNTPRCIGCQPPKFASLVRSREILAQLPNELGRRWETLIASPCGRLLSETGIRELAETGGLPEAWRGLRPHPLPAASVGVGGRGGGVWEMAGEFNAMRDEERAAAQFDRWRELSEAEMERFFESQK